MLHYARVATTVASIIKNTGSTRQILIEKLTLTASTTGTVVITDTVVSYTIDVIAGVNPGIHMPFVFEPGKDVTITPTGPSLSIFAEFTIK